MALTVDDAQLLRLAAEPPRNAARLLDRSRAFAPLTALMAVVLPILAAACANFDDETALWGLKGLALQQAQQLDEWLIPGLNWRDGDTLFEPPLQAWLNSILLPWSPTGGVAGLLAVAAISLMLATWSINSWLRDAGSPALALLTTVLLAVHSQWLLMAVTGGSDAATVALLAATGMCLWRHWRTPTNVVSGWLLAAGLAWGAALLAGGVLACQFLITLVIWQLLVPMFAVDSGSDSTSTSSSATPSTSVSSATSKATSTTPTSTAPPSSGVPPIRCYFWSLPILFATGAALGSWWWAMMVERFGFEFLTAWLTYSHDAVTPPYYSAWKDARGELFQWFQRGSFLTGFLWVGLWTAGRGLWQRDVRSAGPLRSFMLLWLLGGVVSRWLPYWFPVIGWASARHWESYCVIPATFLAADGVVMVLKRQISPRQAQISFALTAGGAAWAISEDARIGLWLAVLVWILLIFSTPLALVLRQSSLAWNDREIRRWIQVCVTLSILGHALWGIGIWWERPTERLVYETSREKLRRISPPTQISLVTSEISDDPLQLEFLLRSLFPEAPINRSIGWDAALTETIVREFRQPRSRMLVVEWSFRELRFRADIGSGWQVTPVVDPIPMLGRRFAIHLIEPGPTR